MSKRGRFLLLALCCFAAGSGAPHASWWVVALYCGYLAWQADYFARWIGEGS